MDVKHLLKRGALLAAANWPIVAIQFIAETTFQVLLAVPLVGAAILVAVLLGGDLADLLQGSLREIFTTIASTLMSAPVALVSFISAFVTTGHDISNEEAERWMAEQRELAGRGEFFFAVIQFCFAAEHSA